MTIPSNTIVHIGVNFANKNGKGAKGAKSTMGVRN
jgi:hypothetical protein